MTALVTGTLPGPPVWATLEPARRLRRSRAGTASRSCCRGGRAAGRSAAERALSSIARCEDRPLRRRRAPPAARDPAGARAGHSRRRRRPQPRRARACRSPTSPRRSTSPTSTRSTEVARRHAVDGALTVSADRAVPVVAAVTERLGLPSIGTSVAQRMRNKIVMRRAFADDGVPQPPFAAVRSLAEGRRALKTVGLPAVLKPADSGGQRGVFRIESEDDLDRHLHAALAESAEQECILEGFVDGHRDERDRDRARRHRRGRDALRPAAAARHRLRRRLDPRLPGVGLRRPARALGARRRARRRGARPPRRDRLPAADRAPGRVGRGRRGRGADPRRPDGRPRAPRDRRRPRRRRAAVRARRAGSRRGRAAALPAAARDPVPHRRARARCRPAG